jgi:hypothetical protein
MHPRVRACLLIVVLFGATAVGPVLAQETSPPAAPARAEDPASPRDPAPRSPSAEFVRVATDPATAIRQGDTEGCGPVSLLNLLKLGPEPYRKAYAGISGGDDKRALSLLAERYCSPTGADGKAKYSHESGINDPNLSRLCSAVAAEYRLPAIDTLYTNRKADESNADFAVRVNRALIASLSRGLPVVMSIDSYGERDGKWRKLTGHYMLITGVQRMGKANPESFLIEFVNPAGGEHRQAFVFADGREHRGALAHFPDGDKRLAGNPYLSVASPYTDLRRNGLNVAARHEFYLTVVFGGFAP